MAWSRPTITSGVTRATKALFDAFGDGIDEAHSALAQKANASSLAAKLDKTEAAASYAPVSTAVEVKPGTIPGTVSSIRYMDGVYPDVYEETY